MRQNSRVEPPTPLAPAIVLHPVLSSALASLDIQLEDELARYRRQRDLGRPVRQPGRKRSAASLNLIAIAAVSDSHSTDTPPAPALEERLADVAGKSIAADTYKPIPAFTAHPQPFEGAIALRTTANAPTQLERDDNALPDGAAHALAQTDHPNLDDYLESSEELLRSLADKQAEVQAERHFMQSLLTPLGLGAMLLLLLSSAMFGYVIMNPSSLPWLTAKQNNNAAGTPPVTNAGQGAIAPPQPDLAKRELPDLNLNNLGTVNPSPGTTSATTSSSQATPTPRSTSVAATKASPAASQPGGNGPVAPAQPAIPAVTSSSRSYTRTTEAPQVAPRTAPVPYTPVVPVRRVSAPPAPASTASVTASNQSTEGSSSYQYKVGIPFENDQTLENARKVVPDAFVRTLPDGRTIVQLGAAHNEAEGRASTQRLRDQGLSSPEVYKR